MKDKGSKLAFLQFNSTWKNKPKNVEGKAFPERSHSNRDRTIALEKPMHGYSDFFKLPYENIEELRYVRAFEEHMPTIQEESKEDTNVLHSIKTKTQKPKGFSNMKKSGSFTKNLSNLSLSSIDSTDNTAPTSKSSSYSSMESTFSESKEKAQDEAPSLVRRVSGLFSAKTDEKSLTSNPFSSKSAEPGLSFIQEIIKSHDSVDYESITLQEALADKREKQLFDAGSVTLQEAMSEKWKPLKSTDSTTTQRERITKQRSSGLENSR